ncbi:MAG: CvpA family protein [Planctomycetaceae bacterium]|nr:CvpA family protein [Planctomycetaceae bacterium]
MIDLFLLAVVAVVTWCVASEGAWGAAWTFLSVLFAGLLAMNYFEPLAETIQSTLALGGAWNNRLDFLAMMLLFIGFIFAFRIGSEQIMPILIDVHPLAFDGVRWVAAGATGYLTMAILLTALHTAPMPRTFMGFTPERNNFIGMSAPDRQWLGFVQYVTEKSFRKGVNGPIFDGSTALFSDGKKKILPTFIIRYATRRGMGSLAAVEDLTPTPAAPSGGGGVPAQF